MGRFSFRAGINAENPDFTITMPDRSDKIRRMTVQQDGSVTEEHVVVAGLRDEDEE